MIEFTQTTNAVTAKNEWILQSSDFDCYQEIARSSFADMLHDTERNKKYEAALAKAIKAMHLQGKRANVLDIGTGTGLLSMMAARNGADTVTACEAFAPIAQCARQVIKQNGFADKIKVIGKRSTELQVGPNLDMERKANILVAEVFDTELIGEGAIETFSHAHRCLLTEDCIVVPTASNMYVLPVQSELLWSHNELLPVAVAGSTLRIPPDCGRYDNRIAATPLHDVQLSQLPPAAREPLSRPARVFRFDFANKAGLSKKERSEVSIVALRDGTCHALLVWWDLEFDLSADIVLSCAPSWMRPDAAAAEGHAGQCQWRDHWMQAVFYPSRPLSVAKGQALMLCSQHDEYSLAFDIEGCNVPADTAAPAATLPSPAATAADASSGSLLHCAFTRLRLSAVNDADYVKAYVDALVAAMWSAAESEGGRPCVCLCVGDGCLLPLLCARLGAAKVWAVESGATARTVMQALVDFNGLGDKVTLVSSYANIPEEELSQVGVLAAEPHFRTTLMPWDNLYFWYVRSYIDSSLPSHVKVVPGRAVLMAVALEFEDLWKIRAPVGSCEGFDLNPFDAIIEEARSIADSDTEALPLWEYPAVALSAAFPLLEFDFACPVDAGAAAAATASGSQRLEWSGTCNGVAMWMEYELCSGDAGNGGDRGCDDSRGERTPAPPVRVTQGPRSALQPGRRVDWVTRCRQAVYLLRQPVAVRASESCLEYSVSLQKRSGDFGCAFSVSEGVGTAPGCGR